MKVFLSWSKDLSRDVAQYFAEWLPGVIQECSSPFISSDIDKGEPWFETITGNLGSTDLGLVFITAENQDAVWLNFEAGAMLNKFGKSGVCPILVGLKKGDYDGPLKNLQLTELGNEADVKLLLATINKKCSNPLDQSVLDRMLGVFWGDLQTNISGLISTHAKTKTGHPTSAKRNMDDKVDELLSLMRGIAARESASDERLAATNARYKELMSLADRNQSVAAEKEIRAKLGGPEQNEYPNASKRDLSRRVRLSDFLSTHGSLEVILPDHEQGVVMDVNGTGDDAKLVVHGKNSRATYEVALRDVTVIPF